MEKGARKVTKEKQNPANRMRRESPKRKVAPTRDKQSSPTRNARRELVTPKIEVKPIAKTFKARKPLTLLWKRLSAGKLDCKPKNKKALIKTVKTCESRTFIANRSRSEPAWREIFNEKLNQNKNQNDSSEELPVNGGTPPTAVKIHMERTTERVMTQREISMADSTDDMEPIEEFKEFFDNLFNYLQERVPQQERGFLDNENEKLQAFFDRLRSQECDGQLEYMASEISIHTVVSKASSDFADNSKSASNQRKLKAKRENPEIEEPIEDDYISPSRKENRNFQRRPEQINPQRDDSLEDDDYYSSDRRADRAYQRKPQQSTTLQEKVVFEDDDYISPSRKDNRAYQKRPQQPAIPQEEEPIGDNYMSPSRRENRAHQMRPQQYPFSQEEEPIDDDYISPSRKDNRGYQRKPQQTKIRQAEEPIDDDYITARECRCCQREERIDDEYIAARERLYQRKPQQSKVPKKVEPLEDDDYYSTTYNSPTRKDDREYQRKRQPPEDLQEEPIDDEYIAPSRGYQRKLKNPEEEEPVVEDYSSPRRKDIQRKPKDEREEHPYDDNYESPSKKESRSKAKKSPRDATPQMKEETEDDNESTSARDNQSSKSKLRFSEPEVEKRTEDDSQSPNKKENQKRRRNFFRKSTTSQKDKKSEDDNKSQVSKKTTRRSRSKSKSKESAKKTDLIQESYRESTQMMVSVDDEYDSEAKMDSKISQINSKSKQRPSTQDAKVKGTKSKGKATQQEEKVLDDNKAKRQKTKQRPSLADEDPESEYTKSGRDKEKRCKHKKEKPISQTTEQVVATTQTSFTGSSNQEECSNSSSVEKVDKAVQVPSVETTRRPNVKGGESPRDSGFDEGRIDSRVRRAAKRSPQRGGQRETGGESAAVSIELDNLESLKNELMRNPNMDTLIKSIKSFYKRVKKQHKTPSGKGMRCPIDPLTNYTYADSIATSTQGSLRLKKFNSTIALVEQMECPLNEFMLYVPEEQSGLQPSNEAFVSVYDHSSLMSLYAAKPSIIKRDSNHDQKSNPTSNEEALPNETNLQQEIDEMCHDLMTTKNDLAMLKKEIEKETISLVQDEDALEESQLANNMLADEPELPACSLALDKNTSNFEELSSFFVEQLEKSDLDEIKQKVCETEKLHKAEIENVLKKKPPVDENCLLHKLDSNMEQMQTALINLGKQYNYLPIEYLHQNFRSKLKPIEATKSTVLLDSFKNCYPEKVNSCKALELAAPREIAPYEELSDDGTLIEAFLNNDDVSEFETSVDNIVE